MENEYDIIFDTTFMVGVKFPQCFRIRNYLVYFRCLRDLLKYPIVV